MTTDNRPPQPVRVDLIYPVQVEGRRIDALTIRPPLVRDLRDAQRGGGESADMEIRLFANLCEVETAANRSAPRLRLPTPPGCLWGFSGGRRWRVGALAAAWPSPSALRAASPAMRSAR